MKHVWLGGLAGLALGCSPDPEVEQGEIAGTAVVRWAGAGEGRARVLYTRGDGAEEETTPWRELGDDGAIDVLGLRVGNTYRARVEVETSGGRVRESAEVAFDVAPPPQTVPPLELLTWEPEASCFDGGYVLMSYIGAADATGVTIIDREGRYVWAVENDIEDTNIGRPRPGRDGRSILWNTADTDRVDDLGYIVRRSLDGRERTQTRALQAHHDFLEMPDGELLWNGYELDETVIIDDQPIAADTVKRGPEGAATIDDTEVLWTQFDTTDWPVDLTCAAPEFLGNGFCEAGHGNSLVHLPEDDSLLLLLRRVDALVKMSAEGETEWILGGEGNEFTVVKGAAFNATGTDVDLFQDPHISDAYYDGDELKVLVFDNQEPGVDSRLGVYTVDESAKTVALDWGFQIDQHVEVLGDIRRMGVEGCDHYLVAFSQLGRLAEITPEGEVVWQVRVPSGGRSAALTRVTFLQDLYDFSGAGYP